MIPQMETILINAPETVNYPSKTYRYGEIQITGKIDDLEAIKQAVFHILSIERYDYLIYDDNYGAELRKYIGQDFSYLEATIEQTLREALTQDDRILDVEVTDIILNIQEQQMIDKTKLYSKIREEIPENLIETETTEKNILTDRKEISPYDNISKAKVANVKFKVYCKQGVIKTEVNVNV